MLTTTASTGMNYRDPENGCQRIVIKGSFEFFSEPDQGVTPVISITGVVKMILLFPSGLSLLRARKTRHERDLRDVLRRSRPTGTTIAS